MPEQIQAIINKVLEWWRKFTRRQQVLIISISAVVVVSFIILAVIMTRPTMVQLIACEDGKQAATVKTLLEDEKINYQTSEDGFTFYIDEKDMPRANILLGSNEIPSSDYSINNVIDGSFSTTEADKQKRYKVYLEDKFAKDIQNLNMVEKAVVTLNIPDDDGTIISRNQPGWSSVMLTLSAPISDETVQAIAKTMATNLANETTDNITIMDTDGNLLFPNANIDTAAGVASANQDARDKARAEIVKRVTTVLDGTNLYDSVSVGVNLSMNFDENSYVDYDYSVDEGRTEGYLDSESGSSSTSTSGAGGVPGTDSNDDDTTYVMEDNNQTETSTEEFERDYLPDERITTHKDEIGKQVLDDSSISVTCKKFAIYNQDKMEKDGTLEEAGQTFDEFVKANSNPVQQEVSDDIVEVVARTTGFPTTNVKVVAYEIPMFQYSEGLPFEITDILQIVLAFLIFLMLGFVVFRSLKVEEEEPVEQELTIDDLIASTAQEEEEDELEDIGYLEKSEARLLIEKFVDEKPEAVAQLLRNWLNEDWG
ncbi:flagellar M-ring protein FliF C-terminal domain-containing protein [Pseudobutyrivibrio xylanivorans]|uniref:Flagellar biosynthesis protein n=1 Tax=Pseudobutyrivibrio xylanivorans TaxID=185007 RepID=A0A5P6VSB2_PSEXY|nr:flagellar M-ring protein FliF C-terminal domain-containing protein [Pseudobutyrivibrio xylanivorans]QFJ55476.1 flagellar biosynthesis protein [Pseudobutyrivibrio xylanivorans]